MLDIKYIREHAKEVKENNKNRGVKIDIDQLLELDVLRRNLIAHIEQLRFQKNQGSKNKPTEENISKLRTLGEQIKSLENKLAHTELEFSDLISKVPNMTHPDSPIGAESDFKVLETKGELEKFSFPAKDHEQLMIDLGLIDFERGAKVAASKFYFAKSDLVMLNLALINYGIQKLIDKGFELLETPDLAKNSILSGIGFNPKGDGEDQIYLIADSDLGLIATSEITVGGFHADEILDLSDGPKKYAALSHCFRREAGAYGRASKGLYRVHQFTKLEMFVFCKPSESDKLHYDLLEVEKEIVQELQIPYRVIDIPTQDLGSPAFRKFDVEAAMVMKESGFGEITSCSNCTDYQARRLNIRYRKADGTSDLVHTLNGTAVATSRFAIAIFENFQQADGSILIPKVLQKHIGKETLKALK